MGVEEFVLRVRQTWLCGFNYLVLYHFFFFGNTTLLTVLHTLPQGIALTLEE